MPQEIHYCKTIAKRPPSFFFQQGRTRVGKKILIIGESLARNGWIKSGKAFYTPEGKIVPTGKRLNEELSILKTRLEECAFTEMAKCYIGNNRKLLFKCGILCKDHFLNQVKRFQPKLILSLGIVTKKLLEEIFYKNLKIGKTNKIVFDDREFFIFPLYHPSPANPFGHQRNLRFLKREKRSIKTLLKN